MIHLSNFFYFQCLLKFETQMSNANYDFVEMYGNVKFIILNLWFLDFILWRCMQTIIFRFKCWIQINEWIEKLHYISHMFILVIFCDIKQTNTNSVRKKHMIEEWDEDLVINIYRLIVTYVIMNKKFQRVSYDCP